MANPKIVHLFHSALWVNFAWRTSLCTDAPHFVDGPDSFITHRLQQCDLSRKLEYPIPNFLYGVAQRVDNFIRHISRNDMIAIELGLQTVSPAHPNLKFEGNTCRLNTPEVTQCLFRCVFLDRVLWAFDVLPCKMVQRRHSDTHFHPIQDNYDFSYFLDGIQEALALSEATKALCYDSGSLGLDTPSQFTALRASSYQHISDMYLLVSKALYALTGTLYCLEDKNGKKILDFLRQASGDNQGTNQQVSVPIVNTMLAAFDAFSWKERQSYYSLWFHSPAAIFCKHFPGVGDELPQPALLEKTAIPIGRIPCKILEAEQLIIQYFIQVFASSLSQIGDLFPGLQIFDETILNGDFSRLMNGLDIAMTFSGDVVIDPMPFPSYVRGIQTYALPIIRAPLLFFSISQRQKMGAKSARRIADAVQQEGSTSTRDNSAVLTGDSPAVIHEFTPLLLPSTLSPTQYQFKLPSPSGILPQEQPLSPPVPLTPLPPFFVYPPLCPPVPQALPKANNDPEFQSSKKTENRSSKKNTSWRSRQGVLKKAKEAMKKKAHCRAEKKAKAAKNKRKMVLGQPKQPTVIIQKYFQQLPSAPEKHAELMKILEVTDLTGDEDGDEAKLGQGPKMKGDITVIYQHPVVIWAPYVDPTGEHKLFGRVLFKKEILDVPFTNHSYPFSDLTRWLALCGFDKDEPPWPVPFCQTISKSKFELLSVQQQRELWRKGNIHIFEDDPDIFTLSEDEPLHSFTLLKALGVNMIENRTIYENQRAECLEKPMSGARSGYLRHFFTLPLEDKIDCNVLNITLPVTGGYMQPVYIRNLSLNDELCAMSAPTEAPYDSLQWCLFATPPARTDIHINARKFHTWVNPQSGVQLWMIQEPLPDVEEVNTLNLDDASGEWYGMILRPGDVLLMRANTNYRVVTLAESVTMGGHFYSIDNLERTMLAGIREHLWGGTVTNTTHFKYEGMIYRLGAFLEKVERISKEEAHLIDDEEKERLSVPVELESQVFVPLVSMLLYPERFMPRLADDTWEAGDFPAEILELREMSLKLGYRLLKNKPNLIKQVCDLRSKKLFGER